MVRVPNCDPKREAEIARLEKLLRHFQAISEHRRDAECADVREPDVKALLKDLQPISRTDRP